MTQSCNFWPLNVPWGWGWHLEFTQSPEVHISSMFLTHSFPSELIWRIKIRLVCVCVGGGIIGWWELGTRGRLLADEGQAVPWQTTETAWHCSATRPKPVIQQHYLFCQDDGEKPFPDITQEFINDAIILWSARFLCLMCRIDIMVLT